MLQIEDSGFRGKRQTVDEDQSGSRKGGARERACANSLMLVSRMLGDVL